MDGLAPFLRARFLGGLFCKRQTEKVGGGKIACGLRLAPALGRKRRDALFRSFANLLCSFLNLGRTLGPQPLLLAHQPHRGPIALQAFPRTKLVQAATLAPRSLCRLRSATMPANAIAFRPG